MDLKSFGRINWAPYMKPQTYGLGTTVLVTINYDNNIISPLLHNHWSRTPSYPNVIY